MLKIEASVEAMAHSKNCVKDDNATVQSEL